MILVVDNYDSFTYNLVQMFGELGCQLLVVRNDKISLDEIAELAPSHIVVSPGPGTPDRAGISEDVIRFFASTTPILGVCLGHQPIGEVFGGRVVRAQNVRHGKTSTITHDGEGVFRDIPQAFIATRYHSLALEQSSLPSKLIVTAVSEDGEVMGIRHRDYHVEGVQFHPESILTPVGKRLLANFALDTGRAGG